MEKAGTTKTILSLTAKVIFNKVKIKFHRVKD